MADDAIAQDEYIPRVLDAYRETPGTMRVVRRPDRLAAAQLHRRGVWLMAVENAFVLAAARGLTLPADSPPLGAIRSLAYFCRWSRKYSAWVSPPTTSTISAAKSTAPPKHQNRLSDPPNPPATCAPMARMI
jgi:hypothetical protein